MSIRGMSNNNEIFENEIKKMNKRRMKSFYSLTVLQKIEVLRQLGFYNLPETERIKFLEKMGLFDVDINLDPPTYTLMPDDPDLDYLKENPERKEKYESVNKWAEEFIKGVLDSGALEIESVEGIENLEILKNGRNKGAIVTINHFNPLDSFVAEEIIHNAGIDKALYKVSREGNFTNFPAGDIADYFKFGRTLPLSQNKDTMKKFKKSLETILARGELVLVCPEQSMWSGYTKPKPMKFGAYRWATESNVPVIPMFIGHRDIEGRDGAQAFTIYIGRPIISNKDKKVNENALQMRNENYEFCVDAYEKYYGKTLEYTTKDNENLRGYVKSTPNFLRKISLQKKIDGIER